MVPGITEFDAQSPTEFERIKEFQASREVSGTKNLVLLKLVLLYLKEVPNQFGIKYEASGLIGLIAMRKLIRMRRW